MPLRVLLFSLLLSSTAASAAEPPERVLASELERWFVRRGLARVQPERALGEVAQAWNQALADAPGSGDASDHLSFLLERHQVRDATVAAVAVKSRDLPGLRRRLQAFLEERAPAAELSHYGLSLGRPGAQGAELRATMVLVRRRVEVSSVRAVLGQPLELCALLRSGSRPQVLVSSPDGSILERTARARRGPAGRPGSRGELCVRLGQARRGRYQVEIMVEGRYGPEVAALFPLHVGVAPPPLPVQKLYPLAPALPAKVEASLLALVNRARVEAGARPLLADPALARVARHHARDMQERGFFGHRSPTGGELATRLAEEAIDYLHAGENLALASSPERAHDALMASPSHRKNLLDRRFTHLGVGVSRSARGLFHIAACFATFDEE